MVVKNRRISVRSCCTEIEDKDCRAVLLQGINNEELEMVDVRWLNSMRNKPPPLSDYISQSGSDEVVSVSAASALLQKEESNNASEETEHDGRHDAFPDQQQGSWAAVADPGLSSLLLDTPSAKLVTMQKHAAGLRKAGDLQALLQVRREMLGMCKAAQVLWSVHTAVEDPLALSRAHYDLALVYADLGYDLQAIDHCRWVVKEVPKYAHPAHLPGAVTQLLRDVHLLHGEVLLNGRQQRVQEALQHFLASEGASNVDEVKDVCVRVLCCQCLTLMGVARLKEAQATRAVLFKLEDEMVLLRAKSEAALEKAEKAREISQTPAILSTYGGKITIDEYKMAKRKTRAEEEWQRYQEQDRLLVAAEEEARAEVELEAELANKAERLLNGSLEALFDVTQAEENRLRNSGDNVKTHPLMAKLYRQLAFIGLNLATVYGLMGQSKRQEQIERLKEVLTSHRAYKGFLPHPLVAKAYRELSAVYMEAKQYDKAHEVLDEFSELQEREFAERPACLDVAKAEYYKLKGNIYVAQNFLRRSSETYTMARDLFKAQLGGEDQLVLDLEHRLHELREYTMGGKV